MARYFNGGTVPLVLQWGEGVIMPGEYVDTDDLLGPPWTIDDEADKAVTGLREVEDDDHDDTHDTAEDADEEE